MKVTVIYHTWLGWLIGRLGYKAITLGWFIFPKDGLTSLSDRLVNHESIHVAQQREMGYALQWLWYLVEYLLRLAWRRSHRRAYRSTSFEQEAYENDDNLAYLSERKRWAWVKYVGREW